MATYKKCIAIDPEYDLPHIGLGVALNKLHKYDEAVNEFQSAMFLNPNVAAAYHGLGGALSELGRNKEAVTTYENFISQSHK